MMEAEIRMILLQAKEQDAYDCWQATKKLEEGLGPLGGTWRVGGLLGVAGRLSGTVSPFRALRQTQRSPEGPRHLHRIPRLSEAPWEVP